MSKKIRLMADYGCDPLWWNEPDEVGDIDPAQFALHPETINRLYNWVQAYDARLNWDDPGNSPDLTQEKSEAFEAEGISLWKQLRQELSPHYEVLYFSDRLGKLLSHPSELEVLV
ncbi:hypothetical protein PN499_22425 [Kamptonema animale CS-326]|jgi:hypothetical protein|uniref:hypothetical protein n=1 Tax=Kamptonema animale TaxID=92934 RepID=UPI00232F9FAB|nr:hypothetical protein [Kamptonema animale]MDB9513960.1 hypothetical protein [Kamptonema animale CS-326]